MNLKEITLPIKSDLEEFDKFFKAQMKTDIPLLNIVLSYLTKKKGKRIRPALVFLSAGLVGGINARTHTGAAMVELLHTATLIHDDVVDRAEERRGIPSLNAKWNNKIAVLVGDFLLSKGLLVSIDGEEFSFLKATSTAVKRMSEGELLAIEKIKSAAIDEETYFRIISDKTASLLATCCHIGALSATADKNIHEKMKEYGEMLGVAFQLRDDMFDFISKKGVIGKPVGNDLKEKKITLPLIHAFSNSTAKEKKAIYGMIKKGKLSSKDIDHIVGFAKEKGGIEYTYDMSVTYIRKAEKLIREMPESPYKAALTQFSDFLINRES